jgi:hypothetical protein
MSYEMTMERRFEASPEVVLTLTRTFDEQDGKTLLTLVQAGFETEEDRDSFQSGASGFLDGIARAVASRVTMV